MRNKLTQAQTNVLSFIRDFVTERHMPPTVREICSHFHFKSPHAGTTHLQRLQEKGYLDITPGIARGIRLKDPVEPGIPILGEAPAGTPVTEYSNPAGHLDTTQLFTGKDLFALKVRGDSMIGSGILDGDMVIIRSQPRVPDETIALAYVDGEATIKRIQHTRTGYRLMPANPAYEPIEISADTPDFRIAGPVIGVVRNMQT
ncbi:MAG: repressor LexA [Lentisphaerae bacterium]|nr:repressor LexA [Lentisphaerota bacterium]